MYNLWFIIHSNQPCCTSGCCACITQIIRLIHSIIHIPSVRPSIGSLVHLSTGCSVCLVISPFMCPSLSPTLFIHRTIPPSLLPYIPHQVDLSAASVAADFEDPREDDEDGVERLKNSPFNRHVVHEGLEDEKQIRLFAPPGLTRFTHTHLVWLSQMN